MTDIGSTHWVQSRLAMDDLGLEVGLRQFRDTSSIQIRRLSDGKVFNVWCRDEQVVTPGGDEAYPSNIVRDNIYIHESNLGSIDTDIGKVDIQSLVNRYFIERDEKFSSESKKGSSFITIIHII